jgi:NitT/TauT family transport system substrate-binding protein
MVEAFSRGELDLGYIGLPPAMIGIEHGLRIKCVAGGHVEGTVLTAKSDFGTFEEFGVVDETLRQFKGRAIGTPSRGSIHDVILRQLIDEAGLHGDITVKNFEWADFILEAMEDDVVAAGCGTPPLAVLASRFLNARAVLPPDVMWPYNPSYGIVATAELIADFPENLESFLTLHEEASNLMRNKPQEAVELATKEIGIIAEDLLLGMYRASPKYCSSLPEEYVKSTLAFVPALKKMRYITKSLGKADVFQTDLVERIHKEKPHYSKPGQLG